MVFGNRARSAIVVGQLDLPPNNRADLCQQWQAKEGPPS
jgi:hypothetical protein